MKKLLLKLCAKILYKLADKVNLDLNKNERNDFLELADKVKAVAESL